jgi:hypothetical protein
MKNCLLNILRKIDLFGSPVGVYLAGKSRYKTAFSGSLTLALLIIFVSITITSFFSLLAAENIQIKELNKQYSPTDSINIGKRGLMFAMGFSHPCIYEYLKIKLFWRQMYKPAEKSPFETHIEVPMVNCSIEHFEYNEDYFHKFELNNYLCPKLNATYNLTGAYTDNLFAFLQIKVFYNSTLNFSQIENCPIKSDGKFEVFFTSFHISADDLYQPAKPLVMSEIYYPLESLGYLSYKRDAFFRPIRIQTSPNSIFPISNITSRIDVHTFDSTRDTIGYSDKSTYNQFSTIDYLNIYLRIAFTRTLIERDFSNFADFLAYVGGIWNPLFFTFMVS